jgi:hypothetical protein
MVNSANYGLNQRSAKLKPDFLPDLCKATGSLLLAATEAGASAERRTFGQPNIRTLLRFGTVTAPFRRLGVIIQY